MKIEIDDEQIQHVVFKSLAEDYIRIKGESDRDDEDKTTLLSAYKVVIKYWSTHQDRIDAGLCNCGEKTT